MRKNEFVKVLVAAVFACATLVAVYSPARADNGLMPSPPQQVVTASDNESGPPPSPPRPKVGFNIGEYLPIDSVVQNRFGAQWFTIGLGEGEIPSDETKGALRFELDLLTNVKGDNRAILIPVGIEYELGLGTGAVAPYAGVGAEVVPSVIQSSTDNVKSQLRAAFGGSAYAGLNFSHDVDLEVRYRAMQKTAGYDFDGGEASLGIRF